MLSLEDLKARIDAAEAEDQPAPAVAPPTPAVVVPDLQQHARMLDFDELSRKIDEAEAAEAAAKTQGSVEPADIPDTKPLGVVKPLSDFNAEIATAAQTAGSTVGRGLALTGKQALAGLADYGAAKLAGSTVTPEPPTRAGAFVAGFRRGGLGPALVGAMAPSAQDAAQRAAFKFGTAIKDAIPEQWRKDISRASEENWAKAGGLAFVQSLPQMADAWISSAVGTAIGGTPGGMGVGWGSMSISEAGNAKMDIYQALQKSGADEQTAMAVADQWAAIYGPASGLIEYVTDMAVLGKIGKGATPEMKRQMTREALRKLAGTSIWRTVMAPFGKGIAEGGEEVTQGILMRVATEGAFVEAEKRLGRKLPRPQQGSLAQQAYQEFRGGSGAGFIWGILGLKGDLRSRQYAKAYTKADANMAEIGIPEADRAAILAAPEAEQRAELYGAALQRLRDAQAKQPPPIPQEPAAPSMAGLDLAPAARTTPPAAPPPLEQPAAATPPPLPVVGENVQPDYPTASLNVAPQGEPLPPSAQGLNLAQPPPAAPPQGAQAEEFAVGDEVYNETGQGGVVRSIDPDGTLQVEDNNGDFAGMVLPMRTTSVVTHVPKLRPGPPATATVPRRTPSAPPAPPPISSPGAPPAAPPVSTPRSADVPRASSAAPAPRVGIIPKDQQVVEEDETAAEPEQEPAAEQPPAAVAAPPIKVGDRVRMANSQQIRIVSEVMEFDPVSDEPGTVPVKLEGDDGTYAFGADSKIADVVPILKAATAKVEDAKAKKRSALDAEVQSYGMDPVTLKTDAAKRAAIKRAKARGRKPKAPVAPPAAKEAPNAVPQPSAAPLGAQPAGPASTGRQGEGPRVGQQEPRVETAGKGEAKAEVKSVRVESAPDVKTLSVPSADKPGLPLKEQKQYLLAELDKALADAPVMDAKNHEALAEQVKRRGKAVNANDVPPIVRIEVPGDGTFTLNNTYEALTQFQKAANARFPTGKMPRGMPNHTPPPRDAMQRAEFAARVYGSASKAADRLNAQIAALEQNRADPKEIDRHNETLAVLDERAAGEWRKAWAEAVKRRVWPAWRAKADAERAPLERRSEDIRRQAEDAFKARNPGGYIRDIWKSPLKAVKELKVQHDAVVREIANWARENPEPVYANLQFPPRPAGWVEGQAVPENTLPATEQSSATGAKPAAKADAPVTSKPAEEPGAAPRNTSPKHPKAHAGIYYWADRGAAEAAAEQRGGKVRAYERGYAVQLGDGGAYLGPAEAPSVVPLQSEAPEQRQPWTMTADEYVQAQIASTDYWQDVDAEGQRMQEKAWRDQYLQQVMNAPRDADVPARVLAALPDGIRTQVIKYNERARQAWDDSNASWSMTYRQFLATLNREGRVTPAGDVRELHRGAVRAALATGKQVPANVLAEYPELRAQSPEHRLSRAAPAARPVNQSDILTAPELLDKSAVPEHLRAFVDVVEDHTKLPPAALRSQQRRGQDPSDTEALFDMRRGVVIVNAAHFAGQPRQKLTDKLVHEVAIHRGLRAALGAERFSDLSQQVWRSLSATERAAIAERNGLDPNSEVVGEEWLAYESERVARTGSGDTLWAKIVGLIRRALRALGINTKLGDAEIAGLIAQGWGADASPSRGMLPSPVADPEARYSIAAAYIPEVVAQAKAEGDSPKGRALRVALRTHAWLNRLRAQGEPLRPTDETKTWFEKTRGYGQVVDPDLVCQKSEGCDLALRHIKDALGEQYDPAVAFDLLARANAAGLTTPCPQCYVFWARKATGTANQKRVVVGVGGYSGGLMRWMDATLDFARTRAVRHYSTADFKAEHIPGLILEFIQAQARKIPVAGYTKEADFAVLFGPAGAYINMSVGRDSKVGMDMATAKRMRAKYPNVSTIYVAFNDAEVLRALRDPQIDHVIPWHAGMTKVADMQRLLEDASARDYTDEQGETRDGKLADQQIAEEEHRGDLATYLRLVRQRGLTKKFARIYDMLRLSEKHLYMKLIGPEYGKFKRGKNPPYAPPNASKIAMSEIRNVVNRRRAAARRSLDGYTRIADELIQEVRDGRYVPGELEVRPGSLPLEPEIADALTPTQAMREQQGEDEAGMRYSMRRGAKRGTPVASWFSGTGTMEAALRNPRSVMAVEYDPSIMDAYNAAHGTKYSARDVTTIDPQEVKASGAVLFHASPVCKEFSKANRDRAPGDIDLASARAVAKVIREATPPIVTVENVAEYAKSPLLPIITDALTEKGYKWRVVVMDAAELGAPQHRERMLVQAVRDGDLPPLPQRREAADWYAAVEDLIDEAPDSELPPWESERIAAMKQRGKLDAARPIITMGGSVGATVAAAANSGGPSPTLKAAHQVARIILPDGRVKRVTPRMMARLMGLPDSFRVPDSPTLATKVLGNGMHGDFTRALVQPLVDMAAEQDVRYSMSEKGFTQTRTRRQLRETIFGVRGLLPKAIRHLPREGRAKMRRIAQDGRLLLLDLDAALQTVPQARRNVAIRALERYLKTPMPGSELVRHSNPAVLLKAQAVRAYIDNLSELAIRAGYVTDGMADRWSKNMGFWLRRQYLAFDDDADWNWDRLTKERESGNKLIRMLYQDAFDFLKNEDRSRTDDDVDQILRGLVNRMETTTALNEPAPPAGTGDNARIAISSLLRRQDIPAPIRAWMGEIRDPFQSAELSINWMAQFLARSDTQTRMREIMLATGLASTKPEGRNTKKIHETKHTLNPLVDPNTGEWMRDPADSDIIMARISSRSDLPYRPLRNLYVSPDLETALDMYFDRALNETMSLFRLAEKGLRTYTAWTKRGQVAMNPGAWGANIVGGWAMNVGSGIMGPHYYGEANRILRAMQTGLPGSLTPRQLRDRMLLALATQHGILGEDENIFTADIPKVSGRAVNAGVGHAVRSWLTDPTDKIAGRDLKRALTNLLNKPGEMFIQKPDDVFRLANFLYHLNLARRAFPSQSEEENAAWAAKRARSHYQTYSEIPQIIKDASVAGFLPTYITFTAELLRNTYMIGKTIVEDLISGNPVLMAAAAKRAVLMIALMVAPSILAAISRALVGVSDDDDERIRRTLLPPWDRYGAIIYLKYNRETGEIWYAPLSYLIPHSLMMRFFSGGMAVARAQNPDLEAKAWGRSLLEDFAGPGAIIGPLIDAIATDRPEARPGVAGVPDRAQYFLTRTLLPRFVPMLQNAVRGALGIPGDRGRQYSGMVEGLKFGAVRTRQIDVREAAVRSMKEVAANFAAAQAYRTRVTRRLTDQATGRELNPAGIQRAKEFAYQSRLASHRELMQRTSDFKEFGLTEQDLADLIRKNHITLPRKWRRETPPTIEEDQYEDSGKGSGDAVRALLGM